MPLYIYYNVIYISIKNLCFSSIPANKLFTLSKNIVLFINLISLSAVLVR